MRSRQQSSSPEGVIYTATPYRHDEYVGTADALVAAGIAKHDEFPGQPGRPTTMVSYLPNGERPARGNSHTKSREPGFREIRRISANRFRVSVTVDLATQKVREKARQEEQAAQEQAWQEEQDARESERRRHREATDAPRTAAAYRELSLRNFGYMWGAIDSMLRREHAGFKFALSAEDAEELKDAFETVQSLFANAEITKDKARFAELEATRRQSEARSDAALQRFISAVTKG